MPDPLLSAAIREAYAVAPVNVVILDTLELSHPDFTEPVRVVLAYEDLTATLEDDVTLATFKAFAFTVTFPPMGDAAPAPEFVVRLDGISREIIEQLDLAVESGEKITMLYRAYLSTDLSGPQNTPKSLDLIYVRTDVFSVEARAALPNAANRPFPYEDYTARTFPGLAG
jgi:hypothetical protein